MAIAAGTPAPRFKLPCKPREEVDVGSVIGREKVLLLFFPLAFSSVCTAEMCHFRDNWSDWTQLGCKVFGISIDSPFVVDKFRRDTEIPFPILSDFNKSVAASYDALYAEYFGMKGVAKRAVFVIGTDGLVSYSWQEAPSGEQVDFNAIKSAVQAAR